MPRKTPSSRKPAAKAAPSAKAWSGRFAEPVAERVKRYTGSVDFDRRLAMQDIRGSLAHARMLAASGIITRRDLADIERGMKAVRAEIEAGKFNWSLDAEDVHLNIERRLTSLVGEAGKRLHTARSRNDQVATDFKLWVREACLAADAGLQALHMIGGHGVQQATAILARHADPTARRQVDPRRRFS